MIINISVNINRILYRFNYDSILQNREQTSFTTSVGGIGELYHGIKDSGARFVGAVATDGYTFDYSEAVVKGRFIGLPLDDVNEEDQTDSRIDRWITEISPNL